MSAGEFLADVQWLQSQLPAARHVLNACADRYRFTVGLAASLVAGKVTLLPSTHTPQLMRQLQQFAPDAVCLSDDPDCTLALPQVAYPRRPAPAVPWQVPAIDAGQLIAYVFTSGSTGEPVPHRKTFGALMDCLRREHERLELPAGCTLVATVPPQHMYGLETSVALALAAGHRVCAAHPFYPSDVVAALESVPRPRLLISTPIHLRALAELAGPLPEVDLVLSATAPLTQQLAARIEQRFDTRLVEIFGSTETGTIASRRPTVGPQWQLWPQVRAEVQDEESWISGGHVGERVRLNDVLQPVGPDTFLLHGRVADLVNIAGKRSSLAFLSHQLNSIPGVLDGAFFHPHHPTGTDADTAAERVAACVVAPSLSAAQVLGELRQRVDPVFLPRPLLFASELPRTSTGKLPQSALQQLLQRSRHP